jgi:DNA-binding MarR family transcriptional regulator
MSHATQHTSEKCGYVLGDDGLAHWSEQNAEAWIGLLETHKRLTRTLDAELEAEFGLTLSSLEVLGRLAAAADCQLRMSALASACGLSLSRISRIVDALETRGLVTRCTAAGDGRAVVGQLTKDGQDLVRRAQASHFASVQRSFFEQLSHDEVATLAEIFARFAPEGPGACSASGEATQVA